MATTISSGRANSPKLTANIADHGTIYGGRGLIFDGVTDYLSLADSISLSGQFTISMWVYLDDNTSINLLGDSSSSANFMWIDANSDIQLASSDLSITFTDSNMTTSSWQNILVTRDGSNVPKFYNNGALIQTLSADAGTFSFNQIGTYHTGSNFFNGKMSDVKVFNTALTEAQVQELYLKPEQSAASAVQDNLVAWYPMCEGNPDSPQSIVYDHSEKGKLGSELVSGGDMSSLADAGSSGYAFIPSSNWTYKYSGGSNGTATQYSASDNGALKIYSDVDGVDYYTVGAQGTGVVTGTLYKLTFDAKTNDASKTNLGVRYSDGPNMAYGSHGLDVGVTLTTSFQTFTYYFSPTAHSAAGRAVHFGRHHGTSVGHATSVDATIDNVSIKEVLMGNHATTNFFGDELLIATNWTTNDGWGLSTGTLTYNDSSNGGTILSASDMTNSGLETGKTYQLKYTIGALSSGTASIRIDDSSGNNLIAEASEANGAYTKTFTASSTNNGLGFRFTGLTTSGSSFTVTSYSLKEVGVSSSGFATADSEPTIPQVPLLRYNEKMVFSSGKSTFVKWSNPNILPDSCTSFSYSVWFQINDTNVDDGVITFVDDLGSANTGVGLRISLNRIVLTLKLDGSYEFLITGFTDTGWNHAVFVYDGSSYSNTKLYLNGYVFGTASSTSFPTSLNFANTELYLGTYYTETSNSMGGCIDEVSVYNITLSATEAQELFNDGVALDATTHSKADYLLGYWRNDGISSWVDRSDIQAVSFGAGNNKHILCGTGLADSLGDNYNGSLTVSTWFKNDGANDDGLVYIGAGSGSGEFWISLGASSKLWFNLNQGGWSRSVAFTDTASWHHLVCVYTAGSESESLMYLDGSSVGSTTGTFPSASDMDFATNDKLVIGNFWDFSAYSFDGIIGQTAVWNSALTSSQVSGIYALGRRDTNLTASYGTNLVAYYTMNRNASSSPDTSSTIYDRSTNSNNGTMTNSPTLIGANNGTPSGTPESIIVREGLNSNKDGLGFPFRFDSRNVLRLDGVNDFVEVDYPAMSDQINSGIYTFDFWVKHNKENTSTTETYICLRDNDSASNRFKIQKISVADNASYPILRYAVEGGGDITYNSSLVDTLDEGGWFYIAFVSSGVASRQFYYAKSGADSLTAVTANTSTYGNTNVWDEIHIGQKREGTGALGLEMLNGVIDEVRYYSKALSSTELLKNYKHGKSKHKNS